MNRNARHKLAKLDRAVGILQQISSACSDERWETMTQQQIMVLYQQVSSEPISMALMQHMIEEIGQ